MTFQPGRSGNPTGRPKGISDKRTELRSLLEPHAKEIIVKLIECAKAGDPTALRLCVERLIPRVKPDTGINFELPEGRIDSGKNMLTIAKNVTLAVARGQITIEEAENFNNFLDNQRRQIKIAESEAQREKWQKDIG